MTDAEKREKVIKGLKYLHDVLHWSLTECEQDTMIRRNITSEALALLKVQEPRVMTLEEAKHLTYGSPYIIETNLPKEEPRLMYALFSHLGLQGNFTFAFTDARGYLFDSDYGKRWRCWTSRPDEKRRAETPWN